MKQKKVMLIFGTRPEAIKMAPIIAELKRHEAFRTVVCVTAQHRQMLDQVLEVFHIIPDYDLNIMKQNQSLSDITTHVLQGLDEVIETENPDIILVHGDTTTSFIGALAAFYHKVPVGHVEAGLRTHDKYAPYPEEMNRRLISGIADLNFAPTEQSKLNLLAEGIAEDSITVTGNTAIDALKTTVHPDFHHEILDWVGDKKMILLTAHRRENMGEPLRNIFTAMKQIMEQFEDVKVVYPVHLNPEIGKAAKEVFDGCERIKLIFPLNVLDFHNIMAKSHLILTDSGGVQEEAPSLGVPVLVLRDKTERPEGLSCGVLRLAGTTRQGIVDNVRELLTDSNAYERMQKAQNPYGDGFASTRIVRKVKEFVSNYFE
jgi:UDP-N-acetylglucosamine 2-epimerase (non-hydrolysing)